MHKQAGGRLSRRELLVLTGFAMPCAHRERSINTCIVKVVAAEVKRLRAGTNYLAVEVGVPL